MAGSTTGIWPPAGAWIRRYFPSVGWATARWHLFTGDSIWRREWAGPSLETVCGYHTGPLWALEDVRFQAGMPEAACQLCAGRAANPVRSASSGTTPA